MHTWSGHPPGFFNPIKMTVYVNVFVATYTPSKFYISPPYDTEELAKTGQQRRKRLSYIATVPVNIPTQAYLEHKNKYPKLHGINS